MAGDTGTTGSCAYCGRESGRGGMSRHLAACEKRRAAVAAADAQPGKRVPIVHLLVQDAWEGLYWLHLEMDGTAPLAELDDYLRVIWLECCEHLSEFSVGRRMGRPVGMSRTAAQVFVPGAVLTHTYDFGTSSTTSVRVVSVRQGRPTTRWPIALMARNAPLAATCQECGSPAGYLCTECLYDDDASGELCEAHAKSHPHDEYGDPMPIANSPRTGMCGYSGPADPPY
ncbi:hypothetical protein [Longimicrobium terrae]|nr:hypothetical protein [Longimicrobium terrae]